MSVLCFGEISCFYFTFRPSDLITTLTYVHMDKLRGEIKFMVPLGENLINIIL